MVTDDEGPVLDEGGTEVSLDNVREKRMKMGRNMGRFIIRQELEDIPI